MAIDEIEFYWRPGCPFCMMLEAQLDATDLPVRKINIWEEQGAVERVRAAAGGNETVPTVYVGEHALVNPGMTELEDLVRSEAGPRCASPHRTSSPTPPKTMFSSSWS